MYERHQARAVWVTEGFVGVHGRGEAASSELKLEFPVADLRGVN